MEVSVSASVSVCVSLLSLRLQVTKKEPQKVAASLPVQLQKHRKGGRGREVGAEGVAKGGADKPN